MDLAHTSYRSINSREVGATWGKHQASTKHLKNIFVTKELEADSVCAIFAHTAEDGKNYKTKLCCLEQKTLTYAKTRLFTSRVQVEFASDRQALYYYN